MMRHGEHDRSEPADRTPSRAGDPPGDGEVRGSDPDAVPPPLDFEQLRDSTLDDAAFGREITGVFIRQAQEQLAAMTGALAERDAGALRALAHRLKGGALALGALRVCAAAAALEEAAEAGALDTAESRLGGVRSAFQEVRRILEAHFEVAGP